MLLCEVLNACTCPSAHPCTPPRPTPCAQSYWLALARALQTEQAACALKLKGRVRALASALRAAGVGEGDIAAATAKEDLEALDWFEP